jgi:hypothetical protein
MEVFESTPISGMQILANQPKCTVQLTAEQPDIHRKMSSMVHLHPKVKRNSQ